MRTFTAWEPLQDPEFRSKLDEVRAMHAKLKATPRRVELAAAFGPVSELTADWLMDESDAMRVAAKVADEWLCRICGGTSRTCECES